MSQHKKQFIMIYGPTGVGKTDFALELASRMPSEIINADIGQMYVPLTIGTAKPAWQEEPAPHHLFDILDEPKDFSVIQYRDIVIPLMEEIWGRNRIPILVGGSGFYLHALLFPPQAKAEQKIEAQNIDVSWDALHRIDPKRAAAIHPNDVYRIKRALSIWHDTGILPSEYVRSYNPPSHSYEAVCINRDRKELYQRINERTHIMLQQGWIEECKDLVGTPWQEFLMRKKLIGYPDIFSYLDGKIDRETMVANIQTKTRNYAKRQQVFWQMLQRSIEEEGSHDKLSARAYDVNLTLHDPSLYINQLLKRMT